MTTTPAVELTQRERQILDLLARGEQMKALPSRLGIAYSTVANHIENVKRKTGLRGKLYRVVIWYATDYRN